MRDLLKLFHPAIPHITEELWSHLVGDGLVATASWPDPPRYESSSSMPVFQELVSAVRRFRATHDLPARKELELVVSDPDGVAAPYWEEQFRSLADVAARFGPPPGDLAGHTRLVAGPVQAFIALAGIVDLDAERARLERSIVEVEESHRRTAAKLANPDFRERAPAEIVAREEAKAGEYSGRLADLRRQLAELG
jgi:valyl-tRNA synthetase